MSEYNHGDFPCDMPANTPEFNKNYTGIKWDTPHDEEGNLIRKGSKTESPAILEKGKKE